MEAAVNPPPPPTTTTTAAGTAATISVASSASGQLNGASDNRGRGIVEQSLGPNSGAGNVVGGAEGIIPEYYKDKGGNERLKYKYMANTKSKMVQKLSPNSKKLIQSLKPAQNLDIKKWLEDTIYKSENTRNYLEEPFKNLSSEQCANALVVLMNFSYQMALSQPIGIISIENIQFLDYFFDHDVCDFAPFETHVLAPILFSWVNANKGRIISAADEQKAVTMATFSLLGNLMGLARGTANEKYLVSVAPPKNPENKN
jgi:hypothetical protein